MNFDKKRKGLNLLGLGVQDAIKYFFGGNACLAGFILVLICIFLVREAWLFFPTHHEQLKTYRRSGLEYFYWINDAYGRYKENTETLNESFLTEQAWLNRENQEKLTAYLATRRFVEKEIGDPLLVLRDAIDQRKSETRDSSVRARKLDAVIRLLEGEIDAMRPVLRRKIYEKRLLGIPMPWRVLRVPELKPLKDSEREQVIGAVVNLDYWTEEEAGYYKAVEEQYKEVKKNTYGEVADLEKRYITFSREIAEPLDRVWREAREHTAKTRSRYESNVVVPKQIKEQIRRALVTNDLDTRQLRFGTVLQVVADAEHFEKYARIYYLETFSNILKELKPHQAAYLLQPIEVRNKVEAILEGATGHHADFLNVLRSGDDELDAFPKAVPAGTMDPELRTLLFDLTRLEKGSDPTIADLAEKVEMFVNAFPFQKEAEVVYHLTDRYLLAIEELKQRGENELARFPQPDSFKTQFARDRYDDFKDSFREDIRNLEAVASELEAWRFDNPWRWTETAGAFFLGTKWTRNQGERHNQYGLVPLLAGSLIVSVIALSLAVPISVLAAIYVNQIALFKEKKYLKPAIDLIGAIPSVVLGFLGIMVVGQLLEDLSHWPVFSSLPGFPLEAKLNRFTAGTLLAFMAVPIIFTLAEDALSRVSDDYRDAALSLGATRLQTAFRVILPASANGVLAAVLLGFGRVIGETMIVLLVAGQRISMPDFSKGLGVVTEPGQTMTGIIAQDLGEAAHDSIEYRALFMVGLVLFILTVIINYIGQKVLMRYLPGRK